jgi:hypothetical protein
VRENKQEFVFETAENSLQQLHNRTLVTGGATCRDLVFIFFTHEIIPYPSVLSRARFVFPYGWLARSDRGGRRCPLRAAGYAAGDV